MRSNIKCLKCDLFAFLTEHKQCSFWSNDFLPSVVVIVKKLPASIHMQMYCAFFILITHIPGLPFSLSIASLSLCRVYVSLYFFFYDFKYLRLASACILSHVNFVAFWLLQMAHLHGFTFQVRLSMRACVGFCVFSFA